MEVCIHIIIIIIRFNEASSSKRDFTTVAGSAVGHIPLSSWYVVYQLQSTDFPFLQGFLQTLAAMSPHCSTLHFIPLGRCVFVCVCVEHHHGPGFKPCQQHSIQGAATVIYLIISVLTLVKMLIKLFSLL